MEMGLDFGAKLASLAAAPPVCKQAGRKKLALKPSFVTWILQRLVDCGELICYLLSIGFLLFVIGYLT